MSPFLRPPKAGSKAGSKLWWVHCTQLSVHIPRPFQSVGYPGLQRWFIRTGCEARWLLDLGTYLQPSECASILCLTSAAALGVIRLFLSGLCRGCHPALVLSCLFDPQGSRPPFVPSFDRPISFRGEHRSPSSPFLLFVCLFPSGLLGGLSLPHVVAHVKKPSPSAWLRFSGSPLANSSSEMYRPEFISVFSLSTCIPCLTSHLTLNAYKSSTALCYRSGLLDGTFWKKRKVLIFALQRGGLWLHVVTTTQTWLVS